MEALNRREYDVSVTFESDLAIQKRNRKYRKVDKPTDILSFPLYEYDTPGEISKVIFDTSIY